MSTVVIDAATAAKLQEQTSEAEIRTADGTLVGVFYPILEGTPEDYAWAKSQFTDEEIEAARQEPGGYTTDEVLRHLRAL